MEGEGLTLFRSILTVLAVLLLTYYCSRLLGKRGMRVSRQNDLKVIEQLPVGQGRILLLKAVGRVYLVGVSHAGIQLLKEFPEDVRLDETAWPADGSMGEKTTLQKHLEKCAGNALDWTGEFLKKKAGRFKEASEQGDAPYTVVPGGLSPKEQPFQEILQKNAALYRETVPAPLMNADPAAASGPLQDPSAPKAPRDPSAPADAGDTGPQPIEEGEKDG